jgi:hypothetical protein
MPQYTGEANDYFVPTIQWPAVLPKMENRFSFEYLGYAPRPAPPLIGTACLPAGRDPAYPARGGTGHVPVKKKSL